MIGRSGAAIIAVGLMATAAHAEEPEPDPVPIETPAPAADETPKAPDTLDEATVARLRALYDKRDYQGVKRELLAAYQATPHPSLLFALGQVELALEHYQAAIDYYDRFIATKPPQEQIDLAQQALGAARIQLAKQKPRRHRAWHRADTVLVAGGGVALVTATALLVGGHHLATNHNGSLTDYDARIDRAELLQWSAAGLGAVGVITAGLAVLRWRLRPEDGYEVRATASASTASLQVVGRW